MFKPISYQFSISWIIFKFENPEAGCNYIKLEQIIKIYNNFKL